jgi:hypothetical protein
VNTKYAAELKFLPDESFDQGSHIDSILRSPVVARDLEATRRSELGQSAGPACLAMVSVTLLRRSGG